VSTLHDLVLAVYQWAAMNIKPHVYVALILAVMLIAMMKYDDRRRAKREAEAKDVD